MKKNLLLLAGALAVGSAAWALDEPASYQGLVINRISSNGAFAGSIDDGMGTASIVDIVNGKKRTLGTDDEIAAGYVYSPGMGNYISDDGVMVLSIDDGEYPYYYSWEEDELFPLPVKAGDGTILNYSQGITPDGSRICGQINRCGYSWTETMQQPVVWYRNSAGGYDDYIELPYPALDWTGRNPQYVTALFISDDGKTIYGQYLDYAGSVCLPIVYRENEEGEWEYELLWNIDTTGVEFGPEPEYPSYPYLQDFMTEEEIAAYDAAYEAWQTEYYGIYNTQPILSDFMTEEELQEAIDYWTDLWGYDCSWVIEYNYYVQSFCTEEEYAAYENAYDDWLIELEAVGTSPQLASYATEEEIAAQEAAMEVYYEEVDKYYEWQTVYYELISSVPQFEFNDIYMSANGKYAVTNSRKEDWYSAEVECTTYKFNLEDGTYETLPVGDFLASFVDNNGTVYAGKGASYTYREAYVCQNDEWVPFTDTIVNTHPETYAWMIENMTQTYTDYVYDGWSWSEVEVTSVLSGSPCGSADMSVFASWTATPWDWTIGYESYIIPLGVYTSIADAVVAEGDVTTEYYDLQGRRVANTNNLKNGIYIVRTIDANGKATAKAVKF